MYFDEDSEVTLRFHDPKEAPVELCVALDGSYEFGSADRQLIGALVRRKVISPAVASKLKASLGRKTGCEAWVRGHGIEKAFGVQQQAPLPTPCEVKHLDLAPTSEIVNPSARKKSPAKRVAATQGPSIGRWGGWR